MAALVLALSLPEQFTSRSTYSEPLAQILFLGGLCLVIDSLERDGAGARVTAALGGLALGLTVLARIDGLSDILPLVPLLRAAAPRSSPAGDPADRWPGARHGIRNRRWTRPDPALPGQHQELTETAGAGGLRRRCR